jgi:hypothetical protein
MFFETVFHRKRTGACPKIKTVRATAANAIALGRMNDVTAEPGLFASGNGLNGRRISRQKGNLLLPGALLVAMQTQLLATFVTVNFGLAAFF